MGIDEDGVEQFETHPIFIDEQYSPWDELDPAIVDWLDITAFEAEKAASEALQEFKAGRLALIDGHTVTAGGFIFDADEVAISRMANKILSMLDEPNTTSLLWSLADTATGVMTDITLADLKLAHQLAVLNVSNVWGV